ncbi:oxygenase MpaB family protein [Jongsikchunia kroppenstedtii]|uniref:oxygenase MpaB family protein n=1 Tax=Jongsikchunia kroppenstedtii TaxID=1121721 RepID=UPI000367BB0F|nr:oxygenase MpaB family protein [Jongsikchunia kroppenstedtii]
MRTSSRNHGLDPETDYAEIYRNLALYEFPWDINQALSFALFRTYAVPSIGRLLYETGEFTERTQQRYDDTALLLEAPMQYGFGSTQARDAFRRINAMHHSYDISNDDMRYVLATFVVVPKRWFDDYCWRPLSRDELTAVVRYYQSVGRHMNIKDIPADYAEFEDFLDSYERQHFAYDDGARKVADATLELLTSFYPRVAAPAVDLFSRALMDEPLLTAFRYRRPSLPVRRMSAAALRARSQLTRALPARRKAKLMADDYRVRSYPNGFELSRIGTFPTGCPVPHAERSRAQA